MVVVLLTGSLAMSVLGASGVELTCAAIREAFAAGWTMRWTEPLSTIIAVRLA
jgi:hypothetical protein